VSELQIVPERPVGPLASGSNYVGSWEGPMRKRSCIYFNLKSPWKIIQGASDNDRTVRFGEPPVRDRQVS